MNPLGYLRIVSIALVMAPAVSWAAALTCLTGTDPSVAGDLGQIAQVRSAIDSTCICASFDGSPGNTHSKYVSCTKSIIAAQVTAGNLRKQCKSTVTKYYSTSTCGFPASQNKEPCPKKTLSNGKITCAIKPAATCLGTAKFNQVLCPGFTTCIDAADTDHDGLINNADSGACTVSGGTPTGTRPSGTPTNTPHGPPAPTATPPAGAPTSTRTPTPTPARFVDNGDGTVTDTEDGLVWEKKDAAGGLHDMNAVYGWSGVCTISDDDCQPDAAAAAACSGELGAGAVGCAQCGAGAGTCNTSVMTIWQWLVQLNAANFAGRNDWSIPVQGALETILAESYPCAIDPCVPPAFNNGCGAGCTVATCSCTIDHDYWAADFDGINDPSSAFEVNFFTGLTGSDPKATAHSVRAVWNHAV
ncbi:MAG: DUF1566 domain-containing protein [Candidatus Binatia bacterium]